MIWRSADSSSKGLIRSDNERPGCLWEPNDGLDPFGRILLQLADTVMSLNTATAPPAHTRRFVYAILPTSESLTYIS